jgi:hypothetical protein
MEDFAQSIAEAAEDAVAVCEYFRGEPLDYSEGSLTLVDELLTDAAGWKDELTSEQLENCARSFGCYVLEVARRSFGGRYCWFNHRNAPVLVVGEPAFRVALLTWDKVQERMSGDQSSSIQFMYTGFAEQIQRAEPGSDTLYV